MRRTTDPPRGFSILEATISVALVAFVIVGSLQLAASSVRAREIGRDQPHAYHLARDLLSEILHQAYEDPSAPRRFGPETDEPTATRDGWDDVDDFAGWTRSPPIAPDGAPLSQYAGWTRAVTVARAKEGTPHETAAAESGLKRIVVTVTDPRGRSVSLTGLRARNGAFDLDPDLVGSEVISRAETVVQLGSDPSARLVTSVPILNTLPAGSANLLRNGSAETGRDPWFSQGNIGVITVDPHGGSACLRVTHRTKSGDGGNQDLAAPLISGTPYLYRIWVRTLGSTDAFRVVLDLDTTSGPVVVASTTYGGIGPTWTLLQGQITPSWAGDLHAAEFRVETTSTDDFEFDDASLAEGS